MVLLEVRFVVIPCSHTLKLTDHSTGPKKPKKPLSTSIKSTSSAESTARPSPQPDLLAHPDYGPTPSIPTRVGEAKLPPKLRKKWIHKNLEVLKESCSPTGEMEDKERGSPDRFSSQRRDGMDVDDGASLIMTILYLFGDTHYNYYDWRV